MRFVTYLEDDGDRVGVLAGDDRVHAFAPGVTMLVHERVFWPRWSKLIWPHWSSEFAAPAGVGGRVAWLHQV